MVLPATIASHLYNYIYEHFAMYTVKDLTKLLFIYIIIHIIIPASAQSIDQLYIINIAIIIN